MQAPKRRESLDPESYQNLLDSLLGPKQASPLRVRERLIEPRRSVRRTVNRIADHDKRERRTKHEMDVIREAILDIANGGDGMTLRHLFYRLVKDAVIEKTEKAYQMIGV